MNFISSLYSFIKQRIHKGVSRILPSYVLNNFYNERHGLIYPNDYTSMIQAYKSWVYICAYRNSIGVASVPLKLYLAKKRKSGKALVETRTVDRETKNFIFESPTLSTLDCVSKAIDIEEIVEHPFLKLLRNVNGFFNRFDLMEGTETFLELVGNAYWYIIKNKFGLPVEIWLVQAHKMTVVPDKDKFIKGYVYKDGFNSIPFNENEIIHFKFFSPSNVFYGASPLSAVIDAYNTNENISRYAGAIFKNMGTPEGILTTEQDLGEEEFERLRNEWNRVYGGSSNAGKTAILSNGLQYKAVSYTPKELGFLIGRNATIQEIAAAYGVPVSKLTAKDVNLANAYVGERQYQKDTILPRLRRIEEKLNEKLIPLYDTNLFCAFHNPIPEDKELMLREREVNLRTSYMSINELRAKEGLDPVEWGAIPILPSGNAPLGSSPYYSSGQVNDLAQQISNSVKINLRKRRRAVATI